jgi:5'(3')-deoxyribonucleotidase
MIIFLDLDGVIINWVAGVCDRFNIPYEPEKVTSWDIMPTLTNTTKTEFWNTLKIPGFWEHLNFYPEALSFIEQLQQYGKVILLSSPAIGCAGYRQNWIERNLPSFFKKGHYILTPAKWACASKGTVLIDDSNRNYEGFYKAGGHAILYPQPWNIAGAVPEKEKNNLIIRTISELNNMWI